MHEKILAFGMSSEKVFVLKKFLLDILTNLFLSY